MTSHSRTADTDAPPAPNRIRVCDFLRRKEVVLDIPDDRVVPEDTLISGEFFHRELRKGLFIHGGNAIEERPFAVTSSQEEGLSCIFFLDGEVGARIGDRDFAFKGGAERVMEATAIIKTAPESFRRTTARRQHVRHLVVTATTEWLGQEALGHVRAGALGEKLLRQHMTTHRWVPSARLSALIRDIFAPSVFLPELRDLYLEGRAVEIVAETLAAMLLAERSDTSVAGFSRHDSIRLQRARDLIAADPGQPMSMEFLAREAGVSPSGLQRLFRRAEGQSVFEYIRGARLDRAHEALRSNVLSVQEASTLAGYSSAANFATAFRRRFGCTPREAQAKK